jgi:hypothetical protein
MLQLAAYRSAAKQTDPSRQVGAPLETQFDRSKYLPMVKFFTPIEGAAGVFPVEAAPAKTAGPGGSASTGAPPSGTTAGGAAAKEGAPNAQPKAGSDAPAAAGQLVAALPVDTGFSGFYAVELTAPDGHTDTRRYAYNVQSEEGNLKMVDGPQLESRLGGVKYHFHRAADAFFGSDDVQRADLSRFILYVLVALLIGEQLLAYSVSYHPKSRGVAR